MLHRFLNWRTERRKRREAHDRAWLSAIATTSDGLSAFAHLARDALIDSCDGIQFEVCGRSEKYLCGKLPGTNATVYLNGDGAQIRDGSRELFWSEYYDYDSPGHLVARLIESVAHITDTVASQETPDAS